MSKVVMIHLILHLPFLKAILTHFL